MAATGPAAPLRALWRAAPGDALGRLAVALAGARSVRPATIRGADGEPAGEALVHEDPRLGRFLDAIPMRPSAVTFGRHVLARGPIPEATVRHELEHVRQWALLGPLFLPLYLADSVRLQLAGRDRYRDNRFEAAARRRETPDPGPATAGGRGRG